MNVLILTFVTLGFCVLKKTIFLNDEIRMNIKGYKNGLVKFYNDTFHVSRYYGCGINSLNVQDDALLAFMALEQFYTKEVYLMPNKGINQRTKNFPYLLLH